MELVPYRSIQDFFRKNRHHLREELAVHHLVLGQWDPPQGVDSSEDGFVAGVFDGGRYAGCCLLGPKKKLFFAGFQDREALAVLAAHLHTENIGFSGFVAPRQTADHFAQIWARRTSQKSRPVMLQKLHLLESLQKPKWSPGKLRAAEKRDEQIIRVWFAQFHREALAWVPLEMADAVADTLLNRKALFLWEDRGPVTMIAKMRPVERDISVGWVYTPPEHRGRGYATTCTAAFSQMLLAEGWLRCWLFTDSSNPTSNKIYRRIGYQPVIDFREYVVAEPDNREPSTGG